MQWIADCKRGEIGLMATSNAWLPATIDTLDGYRRMIDSAVVQLTDIELMQRPAPGINSVAVILRHLGGNLLSRWTHFLTTDGEKIDRDRDAEFEDWPGDRTSLLAYFDSGWRTMRSALVSLTVEDLDKSVTIRGESHTVPHAIHRSLTHTSYHVGQMLLIARLVHQGTWTWLTISPGGSMQHNEKTWGTAASRGVAGKAM
jgi:Protein of unknown function (DUF1572)